jgi:hypothetical protein
MLFHSGRPGWCNIERGDTVPDSRSALQRSKGRELILMAIHESPSDEPRFAAIEKKPYEKPGFRYEQVFVTSALSCGKVTSTQGQCTGNTKVS